jgi:hypothetical protein
VSWLLSLVKGFGLRTYAFAASAAVIAVTILRNWWLKKELAEEKAKKERAEAFLRGRVNIDDNLSEIDQDYSHRAAERNRERDSDPTKVPDRLRNNNRY